VFDLSRASEIRATHSFHGICARTVSAHGFRIVSEIERNLNKCNQSEQVTFLIKVK